QNEGPITVRDIAKFERIVARRGEHPAFIRGKYLSVIIVDQRTQANAGWAAQINITNRPICEHSLQDQCGKDLGEMSFGSIDVENISQSALVKFEPTFVIIAVYQFCFYRKTKWR